MVIPLRSGLAAGFAALLALTASQEGLHAHAHRAAPNPLLTADPPNDRSNAAYGGCAALAVGGLGLLARFRRR